MSPVMRPAAPNVNVSAPEPPVRLEIPVNVVVVFSEPLPEPSIDQVFVPSVAGGVFPPRPPAMEPLNDATPAASVKLSVPVPPARLWIPLKAVDVLSVPALLPVITQAFVPSVAASVSLPPPPAIEPLNDVAPAASVKLSAPVPPTR